MVKHLGAHWQLWVWLLWDWQMETLLLDFHLDC